MPGIWCNYTHAAPAASKGDRMKKYNVYLSGRPHMYARTLEVEAENSFEARKVAAEKWGVDVTEVYAVPF